MLYYALMNDRETVRDLARRVKEIAAEPEQAEKTRLWRACNDLKPVRPMVYANPQGGWEELDRQWIILECAATTYRGLEHQLRRLILRRERIPDDYPVTDVFRIPPVTTGDTYEDYGVSLRTTRPDETNGAYHIEPIINGADDIEKLHFRPVRIDLAATNARWEFVTEAIGDILSVIRVGRSNWRYGLTRVLIHMRGFQQMLLDYYENPRLIHRLMAFLRDDFLREIETYRSAGAVGLSNYPTMGLGSGGLGYCSDLPEEGTIDSIPGTEEGIAWGESQETVGVGPDQFDEFVLQYQQPLLKQFGLVDYGCCEGLENKIQLLTERLPNLRWIAVSPWADREAIARHIGSDYVFVYKPNPSRICAKTPDWEAAESDIRGTLEIAQGSPVHIVMKDTKTFQNDGERITRWCEMAMNIACEA
jgi:hypothetical protein